MKPYPDAVLENLEEDPMYDREMGDPRFVIRDEPGGMIIGYGDTEELAWKSVSCPHNCLICLRKSEV